MKLTSLHFERYNWVMPVLSAVLLILAVPPIDLWGVVFIGLVPMFLFTYFAKTGKELCLGWAVFSGIHAGFLTHSTLSDFNWLDDADLFSFFIKISGIAIVLLVIAVFVLYAYVANIAKNTAVGDAQVMMLSFVFLSYVGVEYFFFWLFSGFNYGALFFAAQHASHFIQLVDLGSPLFISFGVLIVNLFVWASILRILKQLSFRVYLAHIFLLGVLVLSIFLLEDDAAAAGLQADQMSVAIIQETGRDPDLTFGYIVDDAFSFPALEGHLLETEGKNLDYIIYPFAPWSGIISSTMDNSRFDREVITMDYSIFEQWLGTYVPKDVVFVTWYTSYSDGNYYNQIGYYKNGKLLAEYTKEKLFPFFDYTPQWALDLGIVSLPFDGTPGVDNVPFSHEDVSIGSLICSEIADATATKNSAVGADVIFSLGSETMFTHQIPGEYNALRAQLSAEIHDMPVVRANKFGPSAVYDGQGKKIGWLDYNETGILYVDIEFTK